MIDLATTRSFFLFGMRGTGKSTLLSQRFSGQDVVWIDLLLAEDELKYRRNPDLLKDELEVLLKAGHRPELIVIDEVQKLPAILDVVHWLIEHRKLKFALTGSSARKLKRGGADLLAGRANIFNLFPLTSMEIGAGFNLVDSISWGTLPALFSEENRTEQEKVRFLKSYVHSYLKEEILSEQIVRNIDPFYSFLDVSAQMNGQILNYSKIGREAGLNDKAVERYYSILEDTLLGFHLLPWSQSLRKQQIRSAKFYFHDTGIVRTLQGEYGRIPGPSTYDFGNLFESFLISELYRLNKYTERDYKLSFLKTKDGVELDLIIRINARKHYCIEIKSGVLRSMDNFSAQLKLAEDIPGGEFMVFSQNSTAFTDGRITVYPWQEGLKKIYGL
jgi:predicted AAA+ superfamily ATPase